MGDGNVPGLSGPPTDCRPDWPRRVRRVAVSFAILLLLGGVAIAWDWWFGVPDDVVATYVGRESCVECHAAEVEQWTGSDHDRAMEPATEATVLGDFANAEITLHGVTSRMYRDGAKFMIRTEGPDGQLADFQIKYTLGIRPLQQYMVEFDRPADMPAHEIARLQVLRISWDTVRKRWIDVPPPDVSDKLSPDDPLHWTGIAQCWNNMCAYCHSTNLLKNYDVAAGLYRTTFSEIDVSCEACHGPASIHVELARSKSLFWDRKRGYGLPQLKTVDTRPQIDTCAPCHSRRGMLAPHFRPGDYYHDYFDNELLEEATYYADGQILDEDYEYGSFLQSKMYHKDIRCSDCHNPHSIRLKQEGNGVCTACHQHPAAKYDTPAHHFHQSDSTGASCAECHMPETTYMEVDPRRDHSIRVPRPDLSVALGTPNACTRCHLSDAQISEEKRAKLPQYRDWIAAARAGDAVIKAELDRIDKWMLESMQEWYKKSDWGGSFAYALDAGRRGTPDAEEALAALAGDRRQPAIVRATALHQRGLLRAVSDLTPEIRALKNEDPQVRQAAVTRLGAQIGALGGDRLTAANMRQMDPELKATVEQIVPLLDDPRRSVRAETGRALAQIPGLLISRLLTGNERVKLDRAIDEYIVGLMESNDRGGAHMDLGILYEQQGRRDAAETAYRTAIRVEPRLTGPRSNLAALLEGQSVPDARSGESADSVAQRTAQRRQEIETLRREELELLGRDARLLPNNAYLQYRYGLSLYLNQRPIEAEQALRAAVQLEPNNEAFLLAIALFFEKFERFAEADETLAKLLQLAPHNPDYLRLRDEWNAKRKPSP